MNLVPNLFILCTYLLLNFWYFLEFSGRLKSLYSSYFTLGNDRITRKTAIFNILKLWLGNILVWQFLSELFGLAMSCPSDFPLLGTLGDQKTHDTALEAPWFTGESHVNLHPDPWERVTDPQSAQHHQSQHSLALLLLRGPGEQLRHGINCS